MAEISLTATDRTQIGSAPSRRLRRQGMIPAIVYGGDLEPIPVTVNHHDATLALNTEAGANAIINLEIGNGDSVLTMARQVDRHPYRNLIRHIDFVKVSLTETVTVSVSIATVGDSPGVKEGGILSLVRNQVEVETLPTNIPPVIEIDVSELTIGDSLRIGDLPQIEGVAYLEHEDRVVVTVTAPSVEVEPEVGEEDIVEGDEDAPTTEEAPTETEDGDTDTAE